MPPAKRTRVLVDAGSLDDGSSKRGIGRYVDRLVDALADHEGVDLIALRFADAEHREGVAWHRVHRLDRGRFARFEHRVRTSWDIRTIPRDVFHNPGQDPPRVVLGPWVQTLHGLAPLAIPDPGYAGERKDWQKRAARYRAADRVIAVSDFCAHDGIERLGLDPERVSVIRHGVDDSFRVSTPPTPSDPPYLLMVSAYGVSKGHRDAFRLAGWLAERGHPHTLKVAGERSPWNEDFIDGLMKYAPRPDRIELLGHLGEDIPAVYRGAAALIVPSRYESFCLPAMEAMASGVPVISYRNSALPETIGDGGVLVPDGDFDALVHAVERVITDPSYDATIRAAAIKRARGFTWSQCAEEHLRVYEDVLR